MYALCRQCSDSKHVVDSLGPKERFSLFNINCFALISPLKLCESSFLAHDKGLWGRPTSAGPLLGREVSRQRLWGVVVEGAVAGTTFVVVLQHLLVLYQRQTSVSSH